MTQQSGGFGCLVGFGGWRSHVTLFAVPPSPSTLDMGVYGWFPLTGLPWIPPCFAFDSIRPPPTFWAPSPNTHLLVMSLNEAKYNLGKVKLETMQYRTSGVAHGIWQGLPGLRLQSCISHRRIFAVHLPSCSGESLRIHAHAVS